MLRKAKFALLLLTLIAIFYSFYRHALYNANQPYARSPQTLFVQYYKLKTDHPEAAREALAAILKIDPQNKQAQQEAQLIGLLPLKEAIALQTLTPPPKPKPPVKPPSITPMTVSQLFDQYYLLKPLVPWMANTYLTQILLLNSQSDLAYRELGYQALNGYQIEQAIGYFEQAFKLKPQSRLAAELAYLFLQQGNPAQAITYFKRSLALSPPHSAETRLWQDALSQLTTPRLPSKQPAPIALPPYQRNMALFYQWREKDPQRAWTALQEALIANPQDELALKEAGYFNLTQHRPELALPFFLAAYHLNPDPKLAMQIGYLYNIQNDNAEAYQYFIKATYSSDKDLAYKAQRALDNLSGLQTKVIPNPFFVDIYYAPFYFSRFKLLDNPLIMRAGIELQKSHHIDLYTSFRYTKDNRSSGGAIPQIYDNNQAIPALGLSAQPLTKVPLIIFAEAGKAYSLINATPTVVNDVRGGTAFFTTWGPPHYEPKPTLPFDLTGSLYGSAIYFSQYQGDIIADLRLREGLRFAAYQNSTFDAYLTGHTVLDTHHEFYNNIFEWGPGLAFTPSTRYNFTLRLEDLKGYYLPVNSPTPNPYPTQYHNNVIQLVAYVRF